MKNFLNLIIACVFIAACSSDGGNGNGAFGGEGGNPGDSAGVKAAGLIDLNGSWTGEGGLSVQGQQVQCEKVEFNFSQTATTLTVNKGEFTCNGQVAAWDKAELTVKDNTVYENNQAIGKINGSEISVFVSEGTTSSSVIITKTGESTITINQTETENGQTVQLFANLKK